MYGGGGVTSYIASHGLLVILVVAAVIVLLALISISTYHESDEYQEMEADKETRDELKELIGIEKAKNKENEDGK